MTTNAQTIERASQETSGLRTAILADAGLSDVFGLGLLLFNGKIGTWAGLPPGVVAVIGGVALLWSLDLFFFGRRNPLPRWLPPFVLGGNLVWIALSIAVLVFGFLPLTVAGKWAVAIIADLVGVLAVAQYINWRRETR